MAGKVTHISGVSSGVAHEFKVGATTVASIDDSGNITANNMPTFVAWTDYTPTVTLVGGAGNTVPVYANNVARYSRNGNTVFVDVALYNDGGAEGAGTGQINIALPIAASANIVNDPGFDIAFLAGTAYNGINEYVIGGQIDASGTTIKLRVLTVITPTSLSGALQNSSTRAIKLKFFYEVA